MDLVTFAVLAFQVPVWSLFLCGVVFGVGGFLLGYHAAVERNLLELRQAERDWVGESEE